MSKTIMDVSRWQGRIDWNKVKESVYYYSNDGVTAWYGCHRNSETSWSFKCCNNYDLCKG